MTQQLQQKKTALEQRLKEMGRVLVAFSSGVDSTFLLKVAHEVLGDDAIAVTAQSPSFPEREHNEAIAFCKKEGIRQIFAESEAMQVEAFRNNPPDRCYLCKKALFTKIRQIAKEQKIPYIIEGSNVDDDADYRPGHIAIKELDIKSPLKEAGLTKADIRTLSKEAGLPTWDKPSFACLVTRFAYGEPLSEERLHRVEQAEQLLFDLGFHQVRVRVHGDIARIELEETEFARFMQAEIRTKVDAYLKELGFFYATLDIGGYQTGSMNKMIQES